MNDESTASGREVSWVKGHQHHQLPITTETNETDPAAPSITVIRSAHELQNLPTETLLTWTDFGERIAGVLFVDQDEMWISHTGPEHWSTSIDHVRYPAQAFTWDAGQ
ncbi:hypothetical protein PP613_23560 [Mycobacteroides abscessus]|nr:hypothetical protein [Mycobacteroides abscessus]MDM2412321.1 hypothetical protein [Mycobacteroides abscessus]